MDALLLLVPQARAGNHNGSGDFHMDRAGRLRRRAPRPGRAVRLHRHPDGLEAPARRAPDGPFSTNILWDRAIEEGRCFGAVHQGLWFDVGTPAAIPRPRKRLPASERRARARACGRSRPRRASPTRSRWN
jgi:MurNAc alpha-1-phosphate uridylyltransferase